MKAPFIPIIEFKVKFEIRGPGVVIDVLYIRVMGTSSGPMATVADPAMAAGWGVEVLTFMVTSSTGVVEAMMSVRVVWLEAPNGTVEGGRIFLVLAAQIYG